MKIVPIIAALLLTAAVPAFASDVCIQNDKIDGWAARDAHSLVVSDVFRKKYLLSVAGWCQDLDFSLGISLGSRFGSGSTCLERGDHVVARGPGVTTPHAICTITKIELYTPEMEKAYKDALEAKRNPPKDPPKQL